MKELESTKIEGFRSPLSAMEYVAKTYPRFPEEVSFEIYCDFFTKQWTIVINLWPER